MNKVLGVLWKIIDRDIFEKNIAWYFNLRFVLSICCEISASRPFARAFSGETYLEVSQKSTAQNKPRKPNPCAHTDTVTELLQIGR